MNTKLNPEPYADAYPGVLYRLISKFGLTNATNMHWFFRPEKGMNFGDWIGPYLFNKMTGKRARLRKAKGPWSYQIFSCGSILSHIEAPDKAIVWGSGALTECAQFERPKKIFAVRGPMSREICLSQGYDCPEVYGDPGVLMPLFYKPSKHERKVALGIVPHHTEFDDLFEKFSGCEGAKIVDVRQPLETVISEISACKAIVSTSLHGVIISHAYNIPVAWAKFSGRLIGDEFKFKDYFLGVGSDAIPSPVNLNKDYGIDDLLEFAIGGEIPDLVCVQDRLLKSCPFNSKGAF
ncbi:polysaccharide pyruvyl transferase family protein [Celeribacter halophilus]|uniref:Polysaccharide pyruvyl transferase n=1 Tax=Celeribacter halophilus TaxID=576117 RepID=A0A1I3VMF6_9RHOB|nr:polysaccharide pyruvyl transferase family protein [Celeribacter halophilus]PZX09459.1 pyruvyl transferase [Celeribacter halophilus]SFJ96584.1 Polysaccharide pyruvyl transferase [Celeribacter halophilus]